ncbi:MAG: hypothetical protein N4A71_00260 [Carboxylicivirga sp.]|jgi:hypothetical protein|nr:hypothetical protein [Carboxylicivirga sp.]
MNKYLIILGLIGLINTSLKAQQYLIFQDFRKISIVDYDTKIESDLYQNWNFKNKIELSNNVRKKFVGYNWESDVLNVYLEDYGKVSCIKFNLDSIQNLISQKIEFEQINEETILQPNQNPYVTYKCKNIKIISRSGEEMKCYIDSTLTWTKKCRLKTFSCFVVGGGLLNPQISQDGKYVLMLIDGNLTEVDIMTGEEKRILKKPLSRFEYSQNGRYIMYRAGGNINIYDKLYSKVSVYEPWSNAFWIYK